MTQARTELNPQQLARLVSRIELPSDFKIDITWWDRCDSRERRAAIQLKKWRIDFHTGDSGWGEGGMYLLEPHISPSGVVQRIFKALLAYDEHELREGGFKLDGIPVLGPHPTFTEEWGHTGGHARDRSNT